MSDHDTVFLELKSIPLKYWNKNQGKYFCARKLIGTALFKCEIKAFKVPLINETSNSDFDVNKLGFI